MEKKIDRVKDMNQTPNSDRKHIAIFVMDIHEIDEDIYQETVQRFQRYRIPFMTVINKIDSASPEQIEQTKTKFPDAVFVSAVAEKNILFLKEELIRRIQDYEGEETIVGDLVPYNGKVVMVVPVDSEAPKERIILPQVQLIRDCLDHGIKSYVVRDTELESALSDLKDVDLVVTDSQAFKRVSQIVPRNIKLTSFSILYARLKGDLKILVDGISQVKDLTDCSQIGSLYP